MNNLDRCERARKIVKWLTEKGVVATNKELATKLGYNPASFSQILSGRVPMSTKFVDKLCSVSRRLNKVWVLDGTGEMLLNEDEDVPALDLDNSASPFSAELDVTTLIHILDGQTKILDRAMIYLEYLANRTQQQQKQIDELLELLKKKG